MSVMIRDDHINLNLHGTGHGPEFDAAARLDAVEQRGQLCFQISLGRGVERGSHAEKVVGEN